MMLEKSVKDKVKELLAARGAWWFMPVQSGFGVAAVDFLGCYRGRAFGIETKRPGVNNVTPRQRFVMQSIRDAGGFTCVENDPDCPSVREMLARIEKAPL